MPGSRARGRALRIGLIVLGLLPVVAATVTAGIVTLPSRTRPCATEYSKGITGRGPLHLTSGPDGRLYATAALDDEILAFDPQTHRVQSYPLPLGINPHDLKTGPDGLIWFDGLYDRLGRLDPSTGRVQMFTGITPGSELHDIAFSGHYAYVAELVAGRVARLDLRTGKIVESRFGLPADNQIHGVRAVPDGTLWATLSNGNAIARFNPRVGRFDKLVRMPIPDAGPREIAYDRPTNTLYFTLFAANQLASYDLSRDKLTLYRTPIEPVALKTAQNTSPKLRTVKLSFIEVDSRRKGVWAATFTSELVRLDLKTHRVTTMVCGLSYPSAVAGLANDREGRLWVAEAFPGRLARIDP